MMQYLLTETEYKELSERPTMMDHKSLVQAIRLIAMKAAGIKELKCVHGYCDDCIFSGNFAPKQGSSFVYKNICPNPAKREFSK